MPVWSWPQEKDLRTPDAVESLILLVHVRHVAYIQSTSCEILGWMKHKLESRLLGEISITSDTQMTPYFWHKVKRN